MKKIISIVGARPQFIKHAPVDVQLQKYFISKTIHTGQHYDKNMSDIFFNDLGMKEPDYLLKLPPQSGIIEQLSSMLLQISDILKAEKPDALLVYGDTTSTLAGTLVSTTLSIPLIHIEAGLRSYNRKMPEEVNRIITDVFSSVLFCPTENAIENLKKEGIDHPLVIKSDDVMCDMIHLVKDKLKPVYSFNYYYSTIHRPYNTDDIERLKSILSHFNTLPEKVVMSIHPRTRNKLSQENVDLSNYPNIEFIDPQGYVENMSLIKYSQAVITDSGGIQKEAYILKKRCITVRSETEWVETLQGNWNTLVFDDLSKIKDALNYELKDHNSVLFGSGYASVEIVDQIRKVLN